MTGRHDQVLDALARHPHGVTAERLSFLVFGTESNVNHVQVLICVLRRRGVEVRHVRGTRPRLYLPPPQPRRPRRPRPSIDGEQVLALVRGRVARRLVEALLRHPGGLAIGALIDEVYGDDPDGGPLTAERTLRVAVCKLRKRLRTDGRFEVVTERGYRLQRKARAAERREVDRSRRAAPVLDVEGRGCH